MNFPKQGRIVATHGRHCMVDLQDGIEYKCFPKGKKTEAAVGDYVSVVLVNRHEGVIESILPRRNLLHRCDGSRSKQFAANVDQLFIVIAVEPTFSDDLMGRALVGAWSVGIKPIILLNKIDIQVGYLSAQARLAPLAHLDIPILEISAKQIKTTQQQLYPYLHNRTSLLLGQSAMGKSTLLNTLVPQAMVRTQAHSTALNMGKHTTTSTRLYTLPNSDGVLIDSPGFQGFGLYHLEHKDIVKGFPEFEPFIAQCRFYNCGHQHEPGCGVLTALKAGKLNAARHALYQRIVQENKQTQSHY